MVCRIGSVLIGAALGLWPLPFWALVGNKAPSILTGRGPCCLSSARGTKSEQFAHR